MGDDLVWVILNDDVLGGHSSFGELKKKLEAAVLVGFSFFSYNLFWKLISERSFTAFYAGNLLQHNTMG